MTKPKDLTMPELKEVKGAMALPKTTGQINCEKYMRVFGFSEKGGKALWKYCSQGEKRAWEVAAQAVINAQPCPHPYDKVIQKFAHESNGTYHGFCTQCQRFL